MTRDTGLLLRGIGGFYTVRGSDGACHTLRAQAKLRRQRLHPMAGDQVVYTPGEGEQNGWLEEILPRKNELVRPPVANIDACVLVISAAYPQADLMLIDRMLIFARMNGVEPVLAVNKCDEGVAERLAAQYQGAQVQVFATCAHTGEGVEALKAALSGRVYARDGQPVRKDRPGQKHHEAVRADSIARRGRRAGHARVQPARAAADGAGKAAGLDA